MSMTADVNDGQTVGMPSPNGEQGIAVNPPNNPSHATLPDNHPVVVAMNAAKAKADAAQARLEAMEQQFAMVQGTLGQIDPNKLAEIKQAMSAQEKAAEREAQIRMMAIQETEGRFTQNLSTLEASLQSSQTQLQKIQEKNSLQSLFSQCGGLDFDSFNALLGSKYRVEYGESQSPLMPPPTKSIMNMDMTPITDQSGRALKPEEILILLRQGKLGGGFGTIVQQTFKPWNQTSGSGYQPSEGSPGTKHTQHLSLIHI